MVDAFGIVEVLDGNAFGVEFDALVDGGHEAGAPVADAVYDGAFAVFDDDETGQVLVGGAESVADPCAEGGSSSEDGSGVHGADATGVVDAAGGAGVDDGEVIGVLAYVFEPIGDPEPALAALFPGAFALEEGRLGFAHGGDGRFEACGELFTGEFVQERFAVERIEVAWTALHEEENDVFRLGRAVWESCGGGGEGRWFGESGIARECRERDCAETASSLVEKVAT